MQQTLSSSLTAYWKFGLPALWSLGIGAATIALWFDVFRGRDNQPVPDWMRWQFLGMWLVGSIYLIWFGSRLRRVSLDGGVLTISNCFREIAVPMTDVTRIRQSYMARPTTIILYLNRETPFGRKIVFLPTGATHFISTHPITDALNEMTVGIRRKSETSETRGTPWADDSNHTFNDQDRKA